MNAAAHDPSLAGLITISAADVGKQGDWSRDKLLELMTGCMGPLAGVTPESMANEVRALSKTLRFESEAADLTYMPFLALTANDDLAPDTNALVRAIEAGGGDKVTAMHVDTDHNWSDHRVALQNMILDWLAARTEKGGAASAAKTTEVPVTVVSGVPYCTGGGAPLMMDILIPAHRSRTPTPAVLVDPRWRVGSRRQERTLQCGIPRKGGVRSRDTVVSTQRHVTVPGRGRGLQMRNSFSARKRVQVRHRSRSDRRGRVVCRRAPRRAPRDCRPAGTTRGRWRLARRVERSPGGSLVFRTIRSDGAISE